jgi:hypothetical protein
MIVSVAEKYLGVDICQDLYNAGLRPPLNQEVAAYYTDDFVFYDSHIIFNGVKFYSDDGTHFSIAERDGVIDGAGGFLVLFIPSLYQICAALQDIVPKGYKKKPMEFEAFFADTLQDCFKEFFSTNHSSCMLNFMAQKLLFYLKSESHEYQQNDGCWL